MKQCVVVAVIEVEDDDNTKVKSIWSQTFSSEKDAEECWAWLNKYDNVNADYFLSNETPP